jgi:hypothetical protein
METCVPSDSLYRVLLYLENAYKKKIFLYKIVSDFFIKMLNFSYRVKPKFIKDLLPAL